MGPAILRSANLGHLNPEAVAVEGWIESPGHHRNLNSAGYRLSGSGWRAEVVVRGI